MENNIKTFMEFLRNEFPTVMDNHFTMDMVENLIRYAYKHKGHSKDSARFMIFDILPEVGWEEIEFYLPEFGE